MLAIFFAFIFKNDKLKKYKYNIMANGIDCNYAYVELDKLAMHAKHHRGKKLAPKELKSLNFAKTQLQYWRLFITSIDVDEDVLIENDFFITTALNVFNLMDTKIKNCALDFAIERSIKTDNVYLMKKINEIKSILEIEKINYRYYDIASVIDDSMIINGTRYGSVNVLKFLIDIDAGKEDLNFFSDKTLKTIKDDDFENKNPDLTDFMINNHPFLLLLSFNNDFWTEEKKENYNFVLNNFMPASNLNKLNPISKAICLMVAISDNPEAFLEYKNKLGCFISDDIAQKACLHLIRTQSNVKNNYYDKKELLKIKQQFKSIIKMFESDNININEQLLLSLKNKITGKDFLNKFVFSRDFAVLEMQEINTIIKLLNNFKNPNSQYKLITSINENIIKECVDILTERIVTIEDFKNKENIDFLHKLIDKLNTFRIIKSKPTLRI